MIESPLLPTIRGYIGGAWRGAQGGATFPVRNPATGEHLADVPAMGAAEAAAGVEAAAAAMAQEPPLEQRVAWLQRIAEELLANKAELGRIITLEQGKPLKEAIGEVEYAAGFYAFIASHAAETLRAHELPERIRGCRWTVYHRPAGVAGLITPWNFPLAMLAKKLSAALGAGCASVTKPAEQTPLTAIAFWGVLERVGLPAGWSNLVTGAPEAIGQVLCTHPAVRLISFTGSTDVGRILMAQVAPHIKRLALELGGNAPFLVFEDADLDAAAEALMANKFRAGGQTCVCANRVLVHAAVAQRFAEAIKPRVERLRVGNGLEPATDIGPLIDRAGFDKVSRHVQEALRGGAACVAGGVPQPPPRDDGHLFPPTVLLGVTPDMLVSREETFGPVIAIRIFDDEARAIDEANGTPFGLAAYLFTRDADRAARVSARLRFGHVGLNTGTGPTPEAPFGGMKQSGFGREGGAEGLLEFTDTQAIASNF